MSTFWQPTNPGWGNAATVAKQKKKQAITARNAATAVQGTDPYAAADDQASQIIAALLADVQAQQDAARASAMQEAQIEAEKGRALAYGLQQLGIANTINQIFGQAGTNQANLAQGFSGQIQQQAADQAAAQRQALLGTGQEGAVRDQGQNMGNVTYGVGGFIPGTELSTLGAAFGAQAALEPGFALQFGEINAAKRRQEWASELQKWAEQKAEILGQKPDYYFKVLDSQFDQYNTAQKAAQADRTFNYKKWKDARDFAYRRYTDQLNAELASGRLSVQEATLKLRQWEAENPEPEWKKDSKTGQWLMVDSRTGKELGRVGGVKPVTKKGKTPAQRQAELEEKRNYELSKISGTPPEAKTFLGIGDSGQVKSPTRTRAQLVKYLVRLYRQRLRRFGVRDKVIVKKVNEMVSAMPNNWFKGSVPSSDSPSSSGNPFG